MTLQRAAREKLTAILASADEWEAVTKDVGYGLERLGAVVRSSSR